MFEQLVMYGSDSSDSSTPGCLHRKPNLHTPPSPKASIPRKPATTDDVSYVKLPVAGHWADVQVASSVAAEWYDRDIAQPATPTPASPCLAAYGVDDEMDAEVLVEGTWVDVKVSSDSAWSGWLEVWLGLLRR
jgi:hypothetical protein